MTDYKKLVDDLRDIGKTMFALGTTNISMDNVSISLAYDKGWGQTANDAAAAIEALQAEVEELKAKKMKLAENSLRFVGKVRELDKRRLEPKQGEWELIDEAEPMRWGCSRCKYLSWETSNYCPRCGAKMEVHDGSSR